VQVCNVATSPSLTERFTTSVAEIQRMWKGTNEVSTFWKEACCLPSKTKEHHEPAVGRRTFEQETSHLQVYPMVPNSWLPNGF
jgi:hypothetical protein